MKEFDLGLTGYWGNTTDKILHDTKNDKFTMRSAKFVVDGALRSGGAALFEPYSDDPLSKGYFRIKPEVLNEYIPKFIEDGWQTVRLISILL
jgi:predicted amidohydrolase YtcJ